MSNTVKRAKALGKYPHAPDFTVVGQTATELELSYDLGDIDHSEFFVRHSLDCVTLEISPSCKGFLVEEPVYFAAAGYPDESPDLDAFLERYSDMRWSTCTSEELFHFFADYFTDVRHVKDDYIHVPLAIVKPLAILMCHLRDNRGIELTAKSMREKLPLDAYLSAFKSSGLGAEEESLVAVQKYIDQLSRVVKDGVEDWSASSYERHAYGAMIIAEVLSAYWDRGGVRDYRLAHAEISYPISKPISSFSTYIFRGKVFVKLEFQA